MIIALPANATSTHAPPAIHLGRRSFILFERGWRRHHWEGEGSLSIKTFAHGQALYDVGHGRYAVDGGSYLILNHGQHYAITIEAPRAVDSFCVFFAAGFAEEVHRGMTAQTRHLLDEPERSAAPLHFFERTYAHDDILSPVLRLLRAALAQHREDYGWLQEQFHLLAQRLVHVHHRVGKEIEALPALRAATRQELYCRLHRAKDYMHASLHQPVFLEELARVACLSTNHFLRTFKQAFQKTPHQYLTDLRLRKARELLRHSEVSITDICAAVGFASLGSFSWLFRRRMGMAPEIYRRQKR